MLMILFERVLIFKNYCASLEFGRCNTRQGYSETENEGEGLYPAVFVRHFAVNFLCQFGDNIGHIIAIPVVYHTGK